MTTTAREAQAALDEADREIWAIPLTLPVHVYRQRLDAAVHRWWVARLALFATEVAEIRAAASPR